jgi:hypothetical protein
MEGANNLKTPNQEIQEQVSEAQSEHVCATPRRRGEEDVEAGDKRCLYKEDQPVAATDTKQGSSLCLISYIGSVVASEG